MVSFDVKSLYTSVPPELAMECVKSSLENDQTFKNRTSLTVDNIMELLQLCLQSNIFQWDDQVY